MTVRNVTPGLQAAASAAQPRTLYRQGSQLMRVEEAPDYARGLQPLTIVAEPDIWLVNLTNGMAQHQRDPGPDLNVHAPVVAGPGTPARFMGLEFGCEMEFLAANPHPPPRRMGQGANQVEVHVLIEGGQTLAVMVDPRRQVPLMVSLTNNGKPVVVMRYDAYAAGGPPRPQLFEPPKGVQLQEAPTVRPRSPAFPNP
jgi:hypothetical protein